MGRVTFSIFNRDFQFISEKDDDEKLKDLAQKFKEKIEILKNETGESDTIKLLVFLSINLLNENIKMKEELDNNNSTENENIITQIIEKIKNITSKD
ncbi:MAG: cell division protein ZapA [Spirochaetales bacterium]|nr:cell division protein ZapA [Exilispira sp.]NMC67669.1 cell division protein ZapA [Spirochaetales bacterium]